jgi:Ca2+-binding RTX toxin-like protein
MGNMDDNSLLGGLGSDTLFGEGNDNLFGGPHDDTLSGVMKLNTLIVSAVEK